MNKFKIKELFFKVLSTLGHYNNLCEYKQFKYKGETYKISIYEADFKYYCILFDDKDNHLYEDIIKNTVGRLDKCVIMSFKEITSSLMRNYIKDVLLKDDSRIIWDDEDSE